MSRRIALIYGPETPDGQAVVTSDYVVGTNDAVIAADASTDNPLIVTLPLAATRTLKSQVTVVKIDNSANPVSVIVQGADTISGVTSINLLNQWDALVVEAAGTGRWLKIESGGGGGGVSDHGALTGLADDDHKQYQLVDINLVTADSDFAAAGINPGTVLYAGSGGDLLTLPTPDVDYSGRSYIIGVSNTATSSVDVDVEDASLINGSLATYTILPGSSVQFTCLDGAGLWITQLSSGTQFDLPKYSTATTNDVLQFGSSGLPEWTDTVDLVNVTSNQVQFDTAATTTDAVGRLRWNTTDQTLNLGLNANVTIRLGQILVQEVTNQHGSTLSPGEAVYVFGSSGNRLTVKKAQANSETTAAKTFGVVLESTANNQAGFVATYGLMRNINTLALTEGAAVWLSAGTAGGLTTTRPDAPDHGVLIGFCVRSHATVGELFVAVTNGHELNELHDVAISSPNPNQLLAYNNSNATWRNYSLAWDDVPKLGDNSYYSGSFQSFGPTEIPSPGTYGSTTGLTSGNLVAHKIVLFDDVTLNGAKMAVRTLGAAGAKLQAGIYASSGGRPNGAPLVTTGEIDLTTGTPTAYKNPTFSNVTLSPGTYFVVYWLNDTTTRLVLLDPTSASSQLWPLGITSDTVSPSYSFVYASTYSSTMPTLTASNFALSSVAAGSPLWIKWKIA